MKHLFVPYQIAKGLKEIGFDEPCLGKWTYYNIEDPIKLYPQTQDFFKGPYFNSCSNEDYQEGDEKDKIAAPLYDQVISWFIQKYQVNIEVQFHNVNCWRSLLFWTAEPHFIPLYNGWFSKNCKNRKEALDEAVKRLITGIKNKEEL